MGFVSQDILKSAETPEGFSRSKPEVGGYSVMLNRKTGKLTKGTDLYFSQQPAGTFSKPLDDTIIDVFDAQGKKQKIPYSQYMANISDFTLEDPKEKTTVYPLEDITVGDKVIPAGQSVQLSKTLWTLNQKELSRLRLQQTLCLGQRFFRNATKTAI